MPSWSNCGRRRTLNPEAAGSNPAEGAQLTVGELAIPPVSGTGDRRFDSCQSDARWRSGNLASFMRSRRGFESHPRYLSHLGGVAQSSRALVCQARGHRFESGRPRNHGGRGVTAASGVVIPVASVRTRPATPFQADAEHGRAQRAVTPPPDGCGGSTPPVRINPGTRLYRQSTSLAPRRKRVRLPPSPLPTEVRLRCAEP